LQHLAQLCSGYLLLAGIGRRGHLHVLVHVSATPTVLAVSHSFFLFSLIAVLVLLNADATATATAVTLTALALVSVKMRKLVHVVDEPHLVRHVKRRGRRVARERVKRVSLDAPLLREAPPQRARILVVR